MEKCDNVFISNKKFRPFPDVKTAGINLHLAQFGVTFATLARALDQQSVAEYAPKKRFYQLL